mmetsp:Transcript_2355/g.5397  ORF Transcript_2355/g.5397 Transcript_2355/m.5397 type:complete len:469 (-) Transcript_2355:1042-2448(-)
MDTNIAARVKRRRRYFLFHGQSMPITLQHVTHVTVQRSLRPVEYYSFSGFRSLVEVEFQHGLQTICQKAFQWCTSLRRIAVPSTVVIIEAYSFAGCVSLVRVQLSEGLKYIGEGAFYHCKAIRLLYIPSTVETIGTGCFSRCYSLADLWLPVHLKTIEMGTFMLCKALQRISVPCTVESIGKSSFCECDALLEIYFAEGLCEIAAYAFAKCSSLSVVSLPSSLTHIGGKAFEDCTSLMGVEFPIHDRLSLGPCVFKGCTALVNVSIPSYTEMIRNDPFQECKLLQAIRNDPFRGCKLLHSNDGSYELIAVVDRFASLPIHKACYYGKRTRLHNLLAAMDDTHGSFVDAYGMTPFHIVVTSATLRADLLGALFDEYSVSTISQKDNHGNTMTDYLLSNRCTKAPSIIKMVLDRIVEAGMSGWGLPKWKCMLSAEIESKCWEGDTQSRHQCVQELYERLFVYRKVELTSM